MKLKKLRIANVRNIRDAVVRPGPNLNIVFGNNGSGKSSLLESIYILGRAHSFRTKQSAEVISAESKELSVHGSVESEQGITQKIDVSIGHGKKTIRIDGTEVRTRINLLHSFPIQFISPLSYLLIEGPPTMRRQFMDWGLFHSESQFPEEWKKFKRCLIQRNMALKDGNSTVQRVWDVEFAKYGTMIAHSRKTYLDELLPYLEEIADQLLPAKKIVFEYFPGWDLSKSLSDVLIRDCRRDRKFGFTNSGPQKSELTLKINKRTCKSLLSRGQIKLLVLAMKLAQINLLVDKRNSFGSLLIDDLCAELDGSNLKNVKQFLSDKNLQCFVTAMDPNSLGTLCGVNTTLFHVEQGRLQEI
jgi:DNA replication and repair protein RecF